MKEQNTLSKEISRNLIKSIFRAVFAKQVQRIGELINASFQITVKELESHINNWKTSKRKQLI